MQITVKRAGLLETLKTNLEAHRKEYLEGLEGWKKKASKELRKHLKLVRDGKQPPYLSMPAPKSHEQYYTRAIAMLEMAENEDIQLSPTDFQHFVQDEWDWKDQFMTVSNSYKGG
jgi:hypothetical protein